MGSDNPGMPRRGAVVGRRAFTIGVGGAVAAALLPGSAAYAHGDTRPRTRLVPLAGAVNTRDLGGYRTYHGRRLRWGQVYRGDALGKLTDGDLVLLHRLGLRTVVDFRGPKEIAKDGADRLPPGATLVNNPVLDSAGDAMTEAIIQALATGDPTVLQQLLGDGKGAALMMEGHRSSVTSDASRAGFGDTLRRIAERETPLLYHCTAGKDRTGWMSALLLTALDVPDDTIVADYMLSNEHRRASNEATYAFLRSRGIDVELVRPLMEQRPEYIKAALDTMRTEYRSVDRYIRHGLGLSPNTIPHLRARLLTR
ncbi:tyrosine-protein phosphatase [Yinghuangia sp. YIM S09857]|uniref:tyrosine-protein phosphatase n=1 Tax=Yinghuangia sp. YIM S09857 TaxID=3436929 RepID=UPI003F52FDCF